MRLQHSEWLNGDRRLFLGATAMLILTTVAYLPALRGGFIWDDDLYLVNNPLLTVPDGLRRIWFSLDSPSQYFPLTYTTFRLERALRERNTAGVSRVQTRGR